jgi:hypothetical protein
MIASANASAFLGFLFVVDSSVQRTAYVVCDARTVQWKRTM